MPEWQCKQQSEKTKTTMQISTMLLDVRVALQTSKRKTTNPQTTQTNAKKNNAPGWPSGIANIKAKNLNYAQKMLLGAR